MATPNLYDNQKAYYSSSADAFSGFNELAVSQATSLFDLKSIYGISQLKDKITVTGTGTVTNADGLFAVSTGATAGSTAVLESTEYGRYVAGFEATPGEGGFLNRMPVNDEVARWGYFTGTEGFGWGCDKTSLFIFIRRKGVERVVYQKDWYEAKGVSPLDFHIYRNPFRWYGEGPVRYEVSMRDSKDFPYLATVYAFAAETQENVTTTPNLPIRAEVENGSEDSDLVLYIGGRQFFVQGNYTASPRPTSQASFGISVTQDVYKPIITFKQKGSFAAVAAKLKECSVYATTNNVHWKLLVNTTVSGSVNGLVGIEDIPAAETAFEVILDSTGFTGGHKVGEGFAVAGTGQASGGNSVDLTAIDLPKDFEITLVAAGKGGSATVDAIFALTEEW